jgi:DNA-binding transcriptional LysR family regulator
MDIIAAFKVFVRVAEAGSFSAVAREQNLSQPAVSRHIAALEDFLGERLLQRTTRSLTLTDDGRDLVGHAQKVLDALEEAETAVGKRRGTVSGTVRVSVPVTFGRLYLAPKIGPLLAAHPGLEVELILSDLQADLVADGIDLAIRAGPVVDSTLIVRRIGNVFRYLLASRDYVQTHGAPRTPQDLRDHQCLVMTAVANPGHWDFHGPTGPETVRVRGRFRSDSGEGIREGVLNGFGIGLLPSWYFATEIASGAVQVLLPDYPAAEMPVHLIYPSRRNLSPRTRAVIDFLMAEFRGHAVVAQMIQTG